MANHWDGSRRERRALDAYVKLRRAAESVGSRLSHVFVEAGLTESQFGVLEAIHHLGPLCQADLGRKILKSGGNMTMVVDNLERRQLVRRERDQKDRRFSTVHLTKEGEQLITSLLPRHVAAIADEFSSLSATEQDELARLCKKAGLGTE
jgi:MarR family 2-MHQ and catechol resistance regulon transcriptional repressor